MPVIYHDLQLVQLRMPRTGSTALKNLLTRASDSVVLPDEQFGVEGQHWPASMSDDAVHLITQREYRVWATRRDFRPWKESIQRVRQGPAPTFGLFPDWPGMTKDYHRRKKCGDEYYDAYCFLYEHLVRPADGMIPTSALPPLDDRTGKMGPTRQEDPPPSEPQTD